MKRRGNVNTAPLTLTGFSPRVHQNPVHPLGGEKVHWTFSGFHLAPEGERE